MNPHVHDTAVNALSRSLQVYLRNASGNDALETFLQDPTNNRSVLSLSAAAARRGPSRSKKTAGSAIYPFVALLRGILAEQLGRVVATRERGFDLVSSRFLSLTDSLPFRSRSGRSSRFWYC